MNSALSALVLAVSCATVQTAAAGGLLFDTVTFDSNPASIVIQPVLSTATTVGLSSSRVFGDGISLRDVSGHWNTGTLRVFTRNGTALFADNSTLGAQATMTSTAGSVLNASTGGALELNTITSALVFDSITSTSSPTRGIGLTTVSGSLNSATTTLSGSVLPSIY